MDMGFKAHVVLYAKGWYRKSGNAIEDLKVLLGKWSNIEPQFISRRDIFQFIIETILYVKLPDTTLTDAFLDAMGEKWKGWGDVVQRQPENVLLGNISTCDGEYCHKEEMFKDVDFT